MTPLSRTLMLLILAPVLCGSSQQPAALPEPVGENVLRIEGTDQASGIHYLKLILLLQSPEATANGSPETLPRFTMECRELAGKRSLHWLLRFDGSPDFRFQAPILATKENPYPTKNPSTNINMRFEGYMRSQEFKRQWEVLPTGELHYRNPGFDSHNLDDPRYFLQWLGSLPNLRIGFAKPAANQAKELVFPMQHLLDQLKKIELCQP